MSVPAGNIGFGSSLLVRNPGNAAEAAGSFVFAVPTNAEFAVDAALALAEKLKSRENSNNVLIAFLEDTGLRDLVTLTDMPENIVLCYLDASGAPGKLTLQHGSRGYIAPMEIIEPITSIFKSKNIPWSFKIRHNTIYKLGLMEGPEALLLAWEEEVNGFVLSGESVVNNFNETIQPAILAEALLEYSNTLSFPILNPDRHYSFLRFPSGSFFFIGEKLTLILMLLTAGISLILYLLHSARFSNKLYYHMQLFLKSFWIFSFLLPLLVLSIKLSGLLYSLLLGFFNAPPGTANNFAVVLAVVLAALMFFLPSPLLDFIRFPKRAWFYGFSAVIISIFGVLFAALLDFSFVPIFLWAYFFTFLGASLQKPVLVFFCALAIPIFALVAILNLLETGGGRFAELFFPPVWNTLESWVAAFQIALLSLPVFLLATRGIIVVQRLSHRGLEPNPIRKKRLIALPLIIAGVILAMVAQILLNR